MKHTEDGLRRLMIAVLGQALIDAASDDKPTRDDALEWFADPSREPPDKDYPAYRFRWLIDAAEVFGVPVFWDAPVFGMVNHE